jgi:hypothetical protein
MSIYEKRLTRAGRRARGGMSGHPEREGGGGEGGGGNLAARKPKFQIPSFRVSEAPPWVRRGTPTSRFHVSKCADSKILLYKSQIPSFRVSEAPSWVRSGGTPKFQITSFRVFEEHPSWVLAQGTPKFQIPSFRVSEAPSSVQGRWNPNFQIPSFRFSKDPSWVATQQEGPTQIPRSKFPSVIPSAHQRRDSTDSRIQSAVSISAPVAPAQGDWTLESRVTDHQFTMRQSE